MTTPTKFKSLGLLSTGDIARMRNVHRTTVWHWIKDGRLGSTAVTPRFRGVSREQLAAFEAQWSTESPPPTVSPKKKPASKKSKKKPVARARLKVNPKPKSKKSLRRAA